MIKLSPLWTLLFITLEFSWHVFALDLIMSNSCKQTTHRHSSRMAFGRREALHKGCSLAGIILAPSKSLAQVIQDEPVDLAVFNAVRSSARSTINSSIPGILPIKDPPPFLSIRGGINGKSIIKIPRVGYSFYKTEANQAERCMALALRAGVRHFDVGTLYGSNSEIGIALEKYLNLGLDGIDYSAEKPELLSILDEARLGGEKHALVTASRGLTQGAYPIPTGSAGRRGRRESLFISHKLSNSEQSTKRIQVRRAVKAQIAALGCKYLDMVSIHSPLTDRDRRLETYAALLELCDAGFVKSVGVANYGIGPLSEIKEAGFDLPSVNQLELSPFNTHQDIVSWCKENGVALGCSAWSKLSSNDGPQEQWSVIADIAKRKGMTKAQVLVRWSLQKGYICVPRSASISKIERIAIAENSYGGVNPSDNSFILSDDEMSVIDGLNVNWKAGKLGRRDGWIDEDVTGDQWDPTDHFN